MAQSKPRVWHRDDPACPLRAIYVGRPTVWGNPYSHRRSSFNDTTIVATREEAIERWFADLTPTFIERIKVELRGKDLVCWCAPKICHADLLLEIAND